MPSWDSRCPVESGSSTDNIDASSLRLTSSRELLEPAAGQLDPFRGQVARLGQVSHVTGRDLRRAQPAVGTVLKVEPDLGRGERQERRRDQDVAALDLGEHVRERALGRVERAVGEVGPGDSPRQSAAPEPSPCARARAGGSLRGPPGVAPCASARSSSSAVSPTRAIAAAASATQNPKVSQAGQDRLMATPDRRACIPGLAR